MLILLDIDGVMVPANSWRRPEILADGFPAFSGQAVCALQHILNKTGANIMLTTSHKTRYSLEKWQQLFATRGISVKEIGALPHNIFQLSRKDEVMNWLVKEGDPEENFVVLDDDKSLNGLPDYLKERLVLTSGSVGLTSELAENAIQILQNANIAYAFV